MIVISLKLLLIIYITNLYRRKISTIYSVQRRNSGKKDANFFAWKEDRMTSVDSILIFGVDVHMGKPREIYPSREYFLATPVIGITHRVRSQSIWNNKKKYQLADRCPQGPWLLYPLSAGVLIWPNPLPPVEVLYGRPPFMSHQKRQACRQDFNHGG